LPRNWVEAEKVKGGGMVTKHPQGLWPAQKDSVSPLYEYT
jgi:hypothetical protein